MSERLRRCSAYGGQVYTVDITTADGPPRSREDQIRESAFALYEARGCGGGHALADWLQAEIQFDTQAAQLADE